jgi:ceramide glucosyltransferase
MSMINHIAASIFAVCVIIHFLSVALALPRVRSPQKGVRVAVRPSVTLVRPVCGLEPFSRQTLDATFDLDWPDYEIIFCVDDPGDPVAALVRELIDARPGRNATLLCGLERVSGNPKLDNMAKGWRAARHDWIVFVDSNVLPPIDYLHRLFLACDGDGDGGMVSAPPAGAEPIGFWSEVECALLNATQARFQYAADSLGFGFAQGKTLFFNRKTLENGGFEALGREPAEDAAATRLVRGNGGKVHLADPPFPQLLGRKSFKEVFGRHVRWARLRRGTFPLLFLPEILVGLWPPLLALTLLLGQMGIAKTKLILIGVGFSTVWYLLELFLIYAARWPLNWRSPLTLIVRDLLSPALYITAFMGKQVVWNGNVIPAARSASRRLTSID